ncbi:MAG: hypothetical protein ACRCVJ_04630 [Clostridium sp.]|uniref:hypothetical protein n=1 Tax=Clostridium sp. TaxID=1506 RepID=UPI003F40D73D
MELIAEVFQAGAKFEINYQEAVRAFDLINKKGEDVAKTLGKTEKATSSFSSKLDKFSSGLGKFAKKGTLAFTTPFVALSTAAFNSASDTNESLSKSEVVFGKNADAIKEWSKSSTTAFGASRNEALEMVSKFGAMGKAMGLNANQTKDYSMNMTQLAGDLASFNNISVDMANTALTGIFTGETEALKGLGIVMTQTNLERYAASKGIKKKIKDMTQAEQVQLRYNYVMSQTKDAQGDYQRTSDSAANSAKTFRKSIDNLMSSFGQFLLAFTPLIQAATGLIVKFNNLDDGTKKMILTIGAITAGVFPALLVIAKLVKAVSDVHKAFTKLKSGITKGITGIKNFASATKNGTNALGKFGKATVNCIKSFGRFTKAIIKNTAMAIKNGAIWVANKAKMLAHKTAQLAVTAATKGMTLAQKALNLAMKMNPIGLVITILLALAGVFVTLYNKCEWFRNGVNKVWSFIKSIFTGFSDFLTGVFTTDWTKSFGAFGNIINAFMHNVKSIFDSVKRIFGGIIDFVTGVFTGDWSKAWEGVKNVFGGIMDGLGAVMKAPLNSVIGLINMAIDGINSISFTAPDWVPFAGGKHFGVDLPKINYLYNGGIVTKPTMIGNNTVAGDKYKGSGNQNEVVMPLDTLLSKMDALGNRPINLNIDGEMLIRFCAKHKEKIDEMAREYYPSL